MSASTMRSPATYSTVCASAPGPSDAGHDDVCTITSLRPSLEPSVASTRAGRTAIAALVHHGVVHARVATSSVARASASEIEGSASPSTSAIGTGRSAMDQVAAGVTYEVHAFSPG